jgi:hypothetical protein
MESDTKPIVLGLRQRTFAVFEMLVEPHQHGLVRYLVSLSYSRDGVEDLLRKRGAWTEERFS